MAKALKKVKKTEEDTLSDRVEARLKQEGIHPFENENVVDEYLILPADLTEEASQELGRFFTAFTQQKMYCRTLLGRCGACIREIEDKLDELRFDIFSELPVKMSIKEKELSLKANPEAKSYFDKLREFKEKANMLDNYLNNLIDGITCLSREITRRENDKYHDDRDTNVNSNRR